MWSSNIKNERERQRQFVLDLAKLPFMWDATDS